MADDELQSDKQAQPVGAEVGAWLRAARESQSLTVDAVADSLHLDTSIVDALEREAFGELGATVFAKGHLRAVAAHLGLDEAEAARRFEAASGIDSSELPELIVQYNKPLRAKSRLPIYVAIAVAAMIVAAGLTYTAMQFLAADADSAAAGATVQATTPPDAAESRVQQPSSDSSNASSTAPASFEQRLARAESQNNEVSLAPPVPSAATVTDAPASRPESPPTSPDGLVLVFSAECWFEVRSASGARLAYGTAQAGIRRTIDGERPLAVTLGVADAVRVEVDGSPFEIDAAMRRGRAARFTIR